MLATGGDECFLGSNTVFEGLDRGVTCEVVEALGGGEDVGRGVVHEVGNAGAEGGEGSV